MTIGQTMLAEFEQELVTTRRFIERLPDDKLDWQPHEKSMSAGKLAMHIAMIPMFIAKMAAQDEFDVAKEATPTPVPRRVKDIVAELDKNAEFTRTTLRETTDMQMAEPWRLLMSGKVLMEIARRELLRSILLNHWYHHRGQFGVYLRLVGAQVPAAYGPSGDEMPPGMG